MTEQLNMDLLAQNAILGPSPFNIQAIKIISRHNEFDVYLDPNRAFLKPLTADHTFKEHCIGIGGSIENIRITAQQMGYTAQIDYCPDPSNRNYLAKIRFEKAKLLNSPYYEWIKKSWSCRSVMNNKAIAVADQKAILDIVKPYSDFLRMEWIEDVKILLSIAKLSAKAETINWSLKSTQSKHRSFLKFSLASMKRKKDGIGYWEFGLPMIMGLPFRIATWWGVYRLLLPFGIAKFVGWKARYQKGKSIRSMGMLVIKESEDIKRWLIGGEVLQRIFLETTKRGINHQFFSSVYIWDDVCNGLGDIKELDSSYQHKVQSISRELRSIVNIENEFVLAAIGFGYTNNNPPEKYRRDLSEFFTMEPMNESSI